MLRHQLHKPTRALPQGQPHKVRVRAREIVAQLAQSSGHALTLSDQVAHTLHHRVLMFDGGDSRRLSQRRHGERGCRHAQVLRNLRVRNRVAHAQTRQALRFGEGAQNDDVLVVVVDV